MMKYILETQKLGQVIFKLLGVRFIIRSMRQ